jgi:argininosuccinate lyase
MIPELEVDTARAERAISPFTYATDLADTLVGLGIPFREAHAVVGKLVADCLAGGRDLTDLSLAELQGAAPVVTELPEWTAAASVRRKRTTGSTHPDAVREQMECLTDQIAERRTWLEGHE